MPTSSPPLLYLPSPPPPPKSYEEGEDHRQEDGSPPRHLKDEAQSATLQESTSNELDQRLANLPVAAAADDDDDDDNDVRNAIVENGWHQLMDTIQTAALTALGRARRQHQYRREEASAKNLRQPPYRRQ
ncbi:hypothetical protein SprV_0200826900 [Sparganum proliferum]